MLTSLQRRVKYVVLIAIIILSGCHATTEDVRRLNAVTEPAATLTKPAATLHLTLVDTTGSCQTSPFASHADQEVINRVQRDARHLATGSLVELYVMPLDQASAPAIRFTASMEKKLPPKQAKLRSERLASDFAGAMKSIRGQPPKSDSTPILEALYSLCARLQNLPDSQNTRRTLNVISDMEPWSPGILTLGSILKADQNQLEELIQQLQVKYPRLKLPPHRITVFYLPTRLPDRVMAPSEVEKLLQFWLRLFEAWGVGELEILQARSYGPIPTDPSAPQPDTAAKPSSGSAPFQESDADQLSPTLTVTNRSEGNDILTFTDSSGKRFVMHLPYGKAVTLTLPPGEYSGVLADTRGAVYWRGRSRFKPYKSYTTVYASGSGGGRLYFGEPDSP